MSEPAPRSTASSFDPYQADEYLEHLFSAAGNQLRTGLDPVRSADGALLLGANNRIGETELQRLQGQRLEKPLEHCLEFNGQLTADTLTGSFQAFIESEADLREISEHYHLDQRIRHHCHTGGLTPVMLQKLSVMQNRLQRVFHRSLFGAWLGVLITTEQKQDNDTQRLAFLAGLYHDIGLLHLPAGLVEQNSFTREEWMTMQRHVLIGARIVAEFANAPERLKRIVIQHHERCDGTGFPAGLISGEIDALAELLALSDLLHKQRFQQILLNHDPLHAFLPFLQVNRETFGAANSSTAAAILYAARGRSRSAGEETDSAPRRELGRVTDILLNFFPPLQALGASIGESPQQKRLRAMAILVRQLNWSMLSSGIGYPTYEPWMARALEEEGNQQEILAAAREIFWLLYRLNRMLSASAGSESQQLNAATEQFVACADKHLSELAELLGTHEQLGGQRNEQREEA